MPPPPAVGAAGTSLGDAFDEAGLSADGGAAAAAAEEAAKACVPQRAPSKGKRKSKSEPSGTPMERCAAILAQIMKRRDADWFNEPVPPDTEGYLEMIKTPMDYGTVKANLDSGKYAEPAAFATDVRLVCSNAVTYSPEDDNECNRAARLNLAAFEKAYAAQGLATDDGAAAAAAEEAAKSGNTRKRKSLD